MTLFASLLLPLALADNPALVSPVDQVDVAPAAVEPAVVEPVAVEPPPPPLTLEEQWAQAGPAAVLGDAVERRGMGDFVGADARLAWLQAHHDSPQVRYHAALSLEFQERYADAIALYSTIPDRWPESSEAPDADFRRALCLEDMGDHRAALRLVKSLQRSGDWNDRDRLTLELEQGVTLLRDDKARRGVRRIQQALDEVGDGDQLSWMRAKAHIALARYLLEEAAEVPMVQTRRASRNLQSRTGNMSTAERHIIGAAQLGEAEYALEGLMLLGDAYLALHDDLLAAPPPRTLTPAQVQIYSAELNDKVAVLKRKAWRYYDEGVTVAVRTQWQGQIASTLRDRRDGLKL
jgi:tetratricopeptide (TPR) repeat protein